MKKLFLPALALAFLLITCKPDDEPQYLGEFRIGQEGEAYIKFEPGSYWVYQNSKTSRVDTITMKSYHSEMRYFQGDRNMFSREHLDIRWTGTNGEYLISTLHPYVDLTPQEALNNSVRYFAMPANKPGVGITSMIHWPLERFNKAGVSGQTTLFNGVHDSLMVKGTWYYDVAEFEVDNDPQYRTPDTNHTKYYWAKNIGLIRRVLLEERATTEIESYDIITYQLN